MNPLVGLGICAAIPILIAILPALSLGPFVGLAFLLGFGIPVTYGFAEWFFLQHRLYEHGIVLRSLPGMRTFVIPHYTIDPGAIEISDKVRGKRGEARVALAKDRQCPFTHNTIRFTGLEATSARSLAKGKLDWHAAGDDYETLNGESVWVPRAVDRWVVSYREPEQHRRLLVETIRQSQQTVRAHNRAGWTPHG